MSRLAAHPSRWFYLLLLCAALAWPLGCAPPAPPPPPATADLSITVSEPDGAPLGGAVVEVDGRTATTDQSGVAAFSGLQPGDVTIIIAAGPDRELTAQETLRQGANALAYTLEYVYQAIGLDDLARFRLRLTQTYGTEAETFAEAAVDRESASAHWNFGDGELVILEGKMAYIKHEGYWSPIDGYVIEAVAGIFAAMAAEYLEGLETSVWQLTTDDLTASFLRAASANGYDCRVYEVLCPCPDEALASYTAFVIASGPFAGRLTRFEYNFDTEATLVTDLWDFNGDFVIESPY